VLAVEFLDKPGLSFRGHEKDKVNFTDQSVNRGNYIATMLLLGKGSGILMKHLISGNRNAKYTSKTIQEQI